MSTATDKGRIIPKEILARGPQALNAYVEAIKGGEVEVMEGRVIVMGLEQVGKTSTIRSFLKKQFNPNEPITDAIATNKIYIEDSAGDWNEVADEKSPVTVIYEEKVAELIAEKILKKAKGEHDQKETENRTGDDAEPLLSKVPENILRKAEQKLRFSATTSQWKTPTNEFFLNIWDFGGQPIYNNIQRIFIPSLAVVCVVFNLEHDLDQHASVRDPTTGEWYEHRMTYLDYVLYFIRSVYMSCSHYELDGILGPPVLLIGTHSHSLGTSEEQRKSETEKKFAKIRRALENKPYEKMVSLTNFTIENSVPFNESGAADIMTEIMKFSKKMVRRLPLKWLLVQQEIQTLKREHVCLETSKVMELLERCGVKQDGSMLLQYLHDSGKILFYPNDRGLKDIIVLDLMHVVILSKPVITVLDPEFQYPILRKDWRKLDCGVLTEALLMHLWSKFLSSDREFDFFVSLLQRFGLLCEKRVTKDQRRLFYVLARLKPVPTSFPDENYGNRAISLYHDFDNYLPDDVFQQAATKFIERFQMDDDEPKLSYDKVGLNIDEEHYVILNLVTIKQRRLFKTTIIRTGYPGEPEHKEPDPNVCKKVLAVLNLVLNFICPSYNPGVMVKMMIPCDVCTDNHFHIVEDFSGNWLQCGRKRMDVTRYQKLFGGNENRKIPIEIIAEGPTAVEAYEKAKEDGSKPFYQTRLMVVGQERVGKTSLIKALMGRVFNKKEKITDGVIADLSVDIKHTTGWEEKLQDDDIAQQDLEDSLATNIAMDMQKKQNYQDSFKIERINKIPEYTALQDELFTKNVKTEQLNQDKPIVTKDVEKPNTEAVSEHHDQDVGKQISFADVGKPGIVSIKSETEHDDQEMKEELKKKSILDNAVSKVKNCPDSEQIEWCKDLILSIWDFAGQDLYYITHQVFLVSRAIYIICFNLCHGLDDYAQIEIHKLEHGKVTFEHHMTNVEFIFFWLRSIHSTTIQSANKQQSPAVIIVGTHRESLPGNAEEKLICANKKLEAIKEKLKGTTYEYLVDKESYFAIDNSLRRPVDKAIEELKTYITVLAKKQPYMGEEIPVKWLEFFAKVEQLSKNKSTIKFNEVKELAKACGIKYDALYPVLKFSHNLGYIVYYGEPETEGSDLNDLVILDRNWLIKIFRKVFTYIRDPEWDKFESLWKRLSAQGIMEESLLKHLLTGPEDEYDDKQFESLLELMQEFHLLLEIKKATGTQKESDRCFYVPSLLADKQRKVDKYDPEIKSVVMLYISFKGFLSEGMFYRLLVMLLKWSQDNGGEAKLFHHQGQFSVDESHKMILSLWSFKRTFIQVAILRRASVGGYDRGKTEPSPKICERVPGFLKGKLDNLFKTYKRKVDYYFFFLCNACNKEKKLIDCLKTDKIECKKTGMMSTTMIHKFFGGLELEQDHHLSTSGAEEEPTTSVRPLSTIVADDGPSSTEGKKDPTTLPRTLSPRTEVDRPSTSEDQEQQSTLTRTPSTTADIPSTSKTKEVSSKSAKALTQKITESELLTTNFEIVVEPSQISKGRNIMDADGGFLTHGKTKLLIKSDALDEQEHVKISVRNCLHEEKMLQFQNLGSRVSPIVRCGPSQTFKKFCTLKLPHNVSNYKDCTFFLLWKECGTNTWKVVSVTDKDTKFTIEEGLCIIETKHFSHYALVASCIKSILGILTRFKMGLFGRSLKKGYQIKAIIWRLCDKETEKETLDDAIEPDEFNFGGVYQFSAVEYRDLKLNIEVNEGWSIDDSKKEFSSFSSEGNTSHKCMLTATITNPEPCNVVVELKQNEGKPHCTKWYDVDETFRKIKQSGVSVKKPMPSQEELTIRTEGFRDFCQDFCDCYKRSDYLEMRFLLCDELNISDLSRTGAIAMELCNKMIRKGNISCENVKVFSEISELTESKKAKDCVKNYTEKIQQCAIEKKGKVLSAYRSTLYWALKQSSDDDLQKLNGYYKKEIENIWELVFQLEVGQELNDSQKKWERFAKLLNETAKQIMLTYTPSK